MNDLVYYTSVFFEWQIVISIAQTFLAALVLWQNLPRTGSQLDHKNYFSMKFGVLLLGHWD
jgi:hypothetical protein